MRFLRFRPRGRLAGACARRARQEAPPRHARTNGSLEYVGLGALQLATEVTKARLRQFQSMITSSAAADCNVAMAMVSLAQRWCGSSTPVNMLGTNELQLLAAAADCSL